MNRSRIIPPSVRADPVAEPVAQPLSEDDLRRGRDAFREKATRDEASFDPERCLTPVGDGSLDQVPRHVRAVLTQMAAHHRQPIASLEDQQIASWWSTLPR